VSRLTQVDLVSLNVVPQGAYRVKALVPDRDSCNLLTLVAAMIVNSVQALLSAGDRFHRL
jgi:hypothetical protein